MCKWGLLKRIKAVRGDKNQIDSKLKEFLIVYIAKYRSTLFKYLLKIYIFAFILYIHTYVFIRWTLQNIIQ